MQPINKKAWFTPCVASANASTNADTNNAHTFNANARVTDTQAQPKTFSLSRDGICVCVAFRAAHSCAMHEHTNSHCANGYARK